MKGSRHSLSFPTPSLSFQTKNFLAELRPFATESLSLNQSLNKTKVKRARPNATPTDKSDAVGDHDPQV